MDMLDLHRHCPPDALLFTQLADKGHMVDLWLLGAHGTKWRNPICVKHKYQAGIINRRGEKGPLMVNYSGEGPEPFGRLISIGL